MLLYYFAFLPLSNNITNIDISKVFVKILNFNTIIYNKNEINLKEISQRKRDD